MNFFSIAWAFLYLGNALFSPAGLFLWGRVKPDVTIESQNVGGLPYEEAERLVRDRLSIPPLVIKAPSGDLIADSCLSFSDNLSYLVRHARRGETLSVTVTRHWADMENDLLALCMENSRPALDAKLKFSSDGFTYSPETTGLICDFHKLLSDAAEALSSGAEEITLSVREYAPSVTEEMLRRKTRTLSTFTTCYDEENLPRSHNISLAASRISGTTLLPGQEFSFNQAVGERTIENGFEIANVIEQGEFVPGVGGGVCQVSTTVFGAALRAGLSVTESRAHSLSVGYVPPSLDAMVSSSSDLKFVNPFDEPVYLLAKTGGGRITFTFYGLPDGKKYVTESVVLAKIAPPEPEIVEGDSGVLRKEKEGLKSESFLLVYDKNGKLISRTRIRKDCYAAVRGKIGSLDETPPSTE